MKMVRVIKPLKMLPMESYSEPELTQRPTMSQDQKLPYSSDEEDDEDEDEDEDKDEERVDRVGANVRQLSPVAVTPAKRPAEDTLPSTKKTKKKPKLIERFWSEDAEIIILQAMIDYSSKKSDPTSFDLNGFQDFIKKKLHTNFSRVQLQDKIRRLKRKFQNKNSKEKDGTEIIFFKSHEKDVYDLSKKVWGVERDNIVEKKKTEASSSVVRTRLNADEDRKNIVEKKKTRLNADEDRKNIVEKKKTEANSSAVRTRVNADKDWKNMTEGMEERMLIAGRDLEGTKEWQKLKEVELELYLHHLEMRVAQTKLVLKRMKAGDH